MALFSRKPQFNAFINYRRDGSSELVTSSKDMVMARLHNPAAYRNNLSDLLGKMQHMHLQQYKHNLMLNQ